MRHLRADINAFDSQREQMQMNPLYFAALGMAMHDAAKKLRLEYGVALIDHIKALLGIERLSQKVAEQAATNDPDMMATANQLRVQCMTCHATQSNTGEVNWPDIFNYDWNAIAQHCNTSPGVNPYLCRSMNGMLSSYGYLLTAYQAEIMNFNMTQQAADEIVRVLVDLKVKGFKHLPEEWRAQAEAAAREVSTMAQANDPAVFGQATQLINACTRCHQQTHLHPYAGFSLRRGFGFRAFGNQFEHHSL